MPSQDIWAKKQEEILAGVQPTVTSIKSAQSALRQKEQEPEKTDSTLASYQQLTLQRYGYADIIRHLLEQSEHKDYPYWFTDFEPLAHFNPEDTTQITGYSVKDSFTSDKIHPWWMTSGRRPPPTHPARMKRAFTASTPSA